MLTEEIQAQEKTGFRLSDHPWMSLVASWVIGILVLILVASIATSLGVPGDAPYRPLITPTLAHILVLFWITPFMLQLPNGKTNLRKYLDDIRLSHIKPFLPLLILGVSSSLILLLLLSVNSFIYRLVQGFPINFTFIRRAIDLQMDLPPQSLSWIVAFPSIFEEVSWRGVMLVLFMKKYSPRKSILDHRNWLWQFPLAQPADSSNYQADFVIRQVIFGSAPRFFLRLSGAADRQLNARHALPFPGEYVHRLVYALFSTLCACRHADPVYPAQSSGCHIDLNRLGQGFQSALDPQTGKVAAYLFPERSIMKKKTQTLHRYFFGLAGLILLAGLLLTALLFNQAHLHRYPALIAAAYQDAQHHLTVPGAREVKLTRTGAYGIYFEHSLTSSIYPDIEMPPAIDCTLTSKATGTVIEAVPDYVKTNRYRSKDLHAGVLIMSLTVAQPGTYTFACTYQDERTEPELRVALGPNYFWEFLRVAWKISLPLLGGSSILCGSLLLAMLLFGTGFAFKVLSGLKSNPNTDSYLN